MQIVIDIDEDTYKDIKRGKIYTSVRDVPQESVVAIANGRPLPKGHGDLIDADAVMREMSVVSSRSVKSQMYIIKLAPIIIEKDGD